MPRSLVDDFIDGLVDFATGFAKDRLREQTEAMRNPPRGARPRRVAGKAPKTPKQPKAKAQRATRQPSEPTLYDELEVSLRASAETIRAAYLSLSKRYHPDVAKQPNAAQRMKQINAAWEILGDPAKRKEYDRKIRGAE